MRCRVLYSTLYFWIDFNSVWVAQWVRLLDLTTHACLSPIRRGFAPGFVNYKKGCTRFAATSDKVYQLLAQGRWFSPGTPASSTTKTGRHDIAEILLKVALNTKIQIQIQQTDIIWLQYNRYNIWNMSYLPFQSTWCHCQFLWSCVYRFPCLCCIDLSCVLYFNLI